MKKKDEEREREEDISTDNIPIICNLLIGVQEKEFERNNIDSTIENINF